MVIIILQATKMNTSYDDNISYNYNWEFKFESYLCIIPQKIWVTYYSQIYGDKIYKGEKST